MAGDRSDRDDSDGRGERPAPGRDRPGAARALDHAATLTADGDTVDIRGGRPAPAALERGATVGRYVILDHLGSGGMGVVHTAYDPELDRKVALKLLHVAHRDPGAGSDGRARLLREAKTLAKIAHPNVVSVHDVGLTDGGVFVAMEFVDGPTLTGWLAERARSWRELAPVFADAGRGLAVAHAAGLVHRDVKPDNIFLGRDGRVRVGDFGLARRAGAEVDEEGTARAAGELDLTRTGAILGTPPYMSPEQHRGEPTDPRTDQFSFCVALYEAACRRRPFEGTTIEELREETSAGAVVDPPREADLPAHVRRAILRGLRPDPDDRFASMDELVGELERQPRRRRRAALAAAAAAVSAVGGTATVASVEPETSALCSGGPGALAEVWNDDARRAGRTAFARAAGSGEWGRVEAVLDRYGAAWTAMHRDACEATRIRGEQSAQLLDARMLCLDDRRRELGQLAGLFADADAALVGRAVEAAHGLSSLAPCADLEVLIDARPMPSDPARRRAAEAVRDDIARARALRGAGRVPAALDAATTAVERGRKLDFKPLEASALSELGTVQRLGGHFVAAETSLRAAARAGLAGGADDTAARAWSELVLLTGRERAAPEDAVMWKRLAEAALERIGGAGTIEAALWHNWGEVELQLDELDVAEDAFERALAIYDEIAGERDPDRATELSALGRVSLKRGRYDEARARLERALAITVSAFGETHPRVSSPKTELAIVAERQGEHERALALYDDALSIAERHHGPDSLEVADSLSAVGGVYHLLGRHEDAIAANRRALAIREQSFGPDHPNLGQNLNNLAVAHKNLERYGDAREYYERALAIFEDEYGDDHSSVGITLNNLAEAMRAQEACDDAIPTYRRAAGVLETALGPEHPVLAHPLTGLGACRNDAGAHARARLVLERSLALRTAQKTTPVEVAETQFELARSLWASPGERERARRLAEAARDKYAGVGEGRARERERVEDWLASR